MANSASNRFFKSESGARFVFAGAGFLREAALAFFFFTGAMKAFCRAPEKTFVLDFLNSKIDKNEMETPPEEKNLETVSFVAHATRGIIHDQRTRRKAMVVLLALAVLMLAAGFTLFQSALNPREHPWFVILFWLACVWLTFTAMLLAIFDLVVIRSEARRAQRALREKLGTDAPNK